MFIADFHIHSKYSRATSKECIPEILEMWSRRKGINLLGTADFTHPVWREELKEKLTPSEEGLYVLKDDYRKEDNIGGTDFKPRFIISGEISSIYKKNGKVRKIHNLILLPGLEEAELISHRLEAIGNLHSDGRPILGLDSKDLLEIVLDICPEAIFIPAHIWTPHFSLYGEYSGFDDIRECFKDLTDNIYAVETGLSSDPPMNWRLSALDKFTLVSNSDAHSPANLAREANIFDTDLSYSNISQALKNRNTKEFYGTIEFFPEEGKYHYDGHRNCKVCLKPAETEALSGICPVCGGRLTVGVLHRVEALADRAEGFVPQTAKHFESLVPLREIIASSLGFTTASIKVKRRYENLIQTLGTELFILREASLSDIELAAGPHIAEGIRRLRAGQVEIHPGYDGKYGQINVMNKNEINLISGQISLFKNEDNNDRNNDKNNDIQKQSLIKKERVSGPSSASSIEPLPSSNPYRLNQEQWEAVSSPEPVIVVMAGPGTGKTRTLVYRIVYLIENCGISPSEITAVTFTNKAANEMRSRLEKHFKNKNTVKAMNIGTFHSICLKILSEERGNGKTTIIDEYNSTSIVEDILKNLQLKISPRDAMKEISLMKSGTISGEENKKELKIPLEVYDLYCSQLKQYDVMDYDDILLEALKKFKNTNLSNSFSYLLVDEFQDINEIQYRLIKEWASNNIFVIGDPEQSIYGFRGSDFRYFDIFKENFPHAKNIRLTQNYRSTPEIIHCAKSVISKKIKGEPFSFLESKREKGTKVRLLKTNNEFSEALFVAKEINRIVGGIDMIDTQKISETDRKNSKVKNPRSFADIAILYRTNHQANIIEQCLIKEGIPYVVAGKDEFLSEKEVRAVIAFFQFLLNPKDIFSLKTYLKISGIYSTELIQEILKNYVSAKKNIPSLIKIIEKVQPSDDLVKSWNFIELLKKYEPLLHKEKPVKLIDSWINDNNLSGIDCLKLLLNTSVFHNNMPSFIQTLILGHESDVVRSSSKIYSSDAVSLMTIHGSKGLEFPVIFICGVNDGLIPLKNSGRDFNLDEERRLFYVGMTRAQDELILITSHDRPSPFISDIPEDSIIKENTSTNKHRPQSKQLSIFDI